MAIILTTVIFSINSYCNRETKNQTIIIKKYHVSLKISKHWTKKDILVDNITYKGNDGFINIGILTDENGGINLINNATKKSNAGNMDNLVTEVIKNNYEDNHFNIANLKVDYQNAKLITSTKQNEATLIVKYPNNIKISARGILFNYLEVTADKKDIKDIATNIKFIL